MATYQLPLDATDAHYAVTVDFDGSTFVLVLDWNQRDEAWYVSLELPDGTQLLDGRRVAIGWPLLRRLVDSRRPAGEIIFIDTTGEDLPPGREDLGTRVVAAYIDATDVLAAGG